MIAINITHDDDNAVGLLAMAMVTKLAKARAKGRSGWDTPECTQQHLSNLLREHVAKGDPVDVANFCAFLTARGESIAPEQTTVYHCPHCGVLSDSPASTTAAAAPRAHPMKPSDLINSAGIIASDGPGEVVRKLDAAFDAAMVAAVAGPARVVGYFSHDNECGFERHETAQKAQDEAEETLRLFRTDAGAYGWSPEVVSVCWGVILGEAVEVPSAAGQARTKVLDGETLPCVNYVPQTTSPAPAALLTKPARIGGGSFGVGVPERHVIDAAQRLHDLEGEREAMTAEQFANEEWERRTLWELIHGPLAVSDEREAFEAFMLKDTSGFSLKREGESYEEFEVATYWLVWKARAALASAAPAPMAWPVARDELERMATFANMASRSGKDRSSENLRKLAEELQHLADQAPEVAPAAPAVDAETVKKAARYDFLHSRDLSTIEFGGVFAGRTPDNVVLNGQDLDDAIDASIATANQPAK